MLKIEVKHDIKNANNNTKYSCDYCGNPLDKYGKEILKMKNCPICGKALEVPSSIIKQGN